MNTGLVGERAPSSDVVVEWHLDLDGLGNEVLDLPEHGQVVLGLDSLGVGGVHARDETSERGDAVSLSDTEHGGVDVGRTGLEGGVGVGDGCRTDQSSVSPQQLDKQQEGRGKGKNAPHPVSLWKCVSMSQLTTPLSVLTSS